MTLTLSPQAAAPPAAFHPERPTVLVVDDAQVDRRLAGWLLEKHGGWQVAYAGDGFEALTEIARNYPQVVLTDIQMPDMDGLKLLEEIRAKYPRLPVVLMTGVGSEEIAIEALRVGAAGYVPKKSRATQLVQTVERVLMSVQSDTDLLRAENYIHSRTTRFVLESDPSLVGPVVRRLRADLQAAGICDEYAALRTGIAVEEALLNAVYHGNLEVPSSLKWDDETEFERLASARRLLSPYRERKVRIRLRCTPDLATIAISDDGPGFDRTTIPDPNDPEMMVRPTGRGLVLMQTLTDGMEFNPKGNRVTLRKLRAGGPTG